MTIFQKSPAIVTKKWGQKDEPNSRYLSKVFSAKILFIVEKLWLFGLFSGDKGDINMWMIKITIKANQIDMDVLFISEVDNVQKLCLSLKVRLFPLFYWFVNFTLTDKHGAKNL